MAVGAVVVDLTAAVRSGQAGVEYWFVEGCYIQELSNSADDPGLSIARARVPPGGVTRWHRLRGVAERYLIQSGQGRVEVGDAPPTPVGPGDVVLIPSMCRQRIHNTGPCDLVFLALCTPRFRSGLYEDLEDVSASGTDQANGVPSASDRPSSE